VCLSEIIAMNSLSELFRKLTFGLRVFSGGFLAGLVGIVFYFLSLNSFGWFLLVTGWTICVVGLAMHFREVHRVKISSKGK